MFCLFRVWIHGTLFCQSGSCHPCLSWRMELMSERQLCSHGGGMQYLRIVRTLFYFYSSWYCFQVLYVQSYKVYGREGIHSCTFCYWNRRGHLLGIQFRNDARAAGRFNVGNGRQHNWRITLTPIVVKTMDPFAIACSKLLSSLVASSMECWCWSFAERVWISQSKNSFLFLSHCRPPRKHQL